MNSQTILKKNKIIGLLISSSEHYVIVEKGKVQWMKNKRDPRYRPYKYYQLISDKAAKASQW